MGQRGSASRMVIPIQNPGHPAGSDRVRATIGSRTLSMDSRSRALDASTGIAKRVVIDCRTSRGGADFAPAIVIRRKDGKVLSFPRVGGRGPLQASVDAILSVRTSAQGQARRHPRAYSTERRQAPRGQSPAVCRGLLNCSRPQAEDARLSLKSRHNPASAAATKGTISRISIDRVDKNERHLEYLIPKGKHSMLVQDGVIRRKATFIVEGNPAPTPILSINASRTRLHTWSLNPEFLSAAGSADHDSTSR